MDINRLMSLDGHIMLGIVNEKLRLECESLDKLALRYDLDLEQLHQKLDECGYRYDPLNNQFKSD
ncbi:hypothetical protein VST7929_01612 [Vibrio stylophorae]|uniref:DUF4250 domain-containing protein n=1 Tax=Vibrio stylophorae TaxID=659351 RepID=A0ABM8ZTU7_9VIBR|nr:DUF4250 domain-containing protein [Vibrio stylophorae]CAH0533737.1 hypothetical protein VST7929_01612 [Vibrio stylophorae]